HSFSTPDLMTFVFSDSIADRFYLHSCPTRRSSDLLEPTHDEAAIAAALAVTKAAKPAVVVLVGDNLDLPEFGRYRLTPAFMRTTDRKSTRLNSSHVKISYAVFCLKPKTKISRMLSS